MMGTIQGFQQCSFWSSAAIDPFTTSPYRFNDIMSRTCFEQILKALTLTDREHPSYVDPFWQIRQLVDAWNENMGENFSPSWISCLDESMMFWVSKYTCPGFMVVPRKP